MPEEESKKEEEKLEFTAEGEAVGYISLEQARVLALRHARDNADFYGRGYARRDLSWDVLDESEREDYYYIAGQMMIDRHLQARIYIHRPIGLGRAELKWVGGHTDEKEPNVQERLHHFPMVVGPWPQPGSDHRRLGEAGLE